MKNLINLLLLLTLTFAFACGSGETAEEAEEGESTEMMAEEAGEMEGEMEAEEEGPLSPPRTAEGTIGATAVTINYSSPSVRGREIWGELVPYSEVWRTGANEATTIQFDKDVVIEGQPLSAGTYTLYTIPGEDQWTIIFNKQTGQWGTEYDEAQDALRVEVTPEEVEEDVEAMDIAVEDGQVVLRWDNLAVPIKVAEGNSM